jgi:hypothetical protein
MHIRPVSDVEDDYKKEKPASNKKIEVYREYNSQILLGRKA